MKEEITKLNEILNNNPLIDKLYTDMSSFQRKIFDRLREDEEYLNNYSFNDFIFDFDSQVVENILTIELDEYLKQCEKNGITNKKNGYTKDITLTTSDRVISFNRPRLRYEKDFDSAFLPKRTRIIKDLQDNILLLYSKNNSLNDIKEILKGMFNINISTAFLSNTISTISEQIFEWRNRQLKRCYFSLNIDCTYITIRDNKNLGSHKIPVYVAVGTTLSGHKEVVGIYLGNEDENKNIIDDLSDVDVAETTSFWVEIFNDLKERGIEKILYIVSDGVSGIKPAIKQEFPEAFYQRCVVHIDRNLSKYTTTENRKVVLKDFKSIYSAPNREIAELNWNEFKETYKDKKALLKHAETYIDEIMPLFNLPDNIRKYIYTNNIVESANSKIKRGFYGRGALPNCESAINIIYVNLRDLENKWAKKRVPNWNKIFSEIQIVHKDIVEKYLD